MKEPNNQLRAGAILSYINLALSTIIPFFYTPVMLRILGQEEYGLYSLSSSVISYLSLLSFGFGSTIVRYITMYRVSGQKKKEEETFGFFLILYCAIAAIVMICGAVLSLNVETLFDRGLSENEISKMQILMIIMAFNSALSFPISVFSSIVMAHERYIFRRLVDMLSTVIVPIFNLIALYLGFASVGMAVSGTIIQFLMLPINVIYCYKNLKIHPKFAKMPSKVVKEMLGFSVFIFIGTIVDMLFWATDKVILGMLVGTSVVAVYNVGCTFNTMVTSLSTSLSSVLTPRITTMITKNASKEDLTNLFIRIGRIQYIIVALVISGFVVFGRDFVKLWAGDNYENAYWIALLTMIPLCVPLIQNTGVSIVVAQNKHKFRSICYLVIAIVNVISTYIVTPYLGGVGAALCSGISYIIGQGVIMNVYYYKVTGINIPLFWKNILKMSVIPIIMMAIGLYLTNVFKISNWYVFLICIVSYTVIYAVLMWIFSINDYEKSVFRNIVMKLIGVINRKQNAR